MAHHPNIQEIDEHLVKGASEPATDGAGFYSNVFAVPKHNESLQPICNLN